MVRSRARQSGRRSDSRAKTESHAGAKGDWYDVDATHPRNVAECRTLVRNAGGRVIEWSIEPTYPALFFEDPAGTRLEICARRPRA
jgi:hypothetical protein